MPRRTRGWRLAPVVMIFWLAPGCTAPPRVDPPARIESAETAGWEGFFPPGAVTDPWLVRRGVPLKANVVQGVARRVGKLVVAAGVRTAPEPALEDMRRQYCVQPAARAWNQRRCAALAARRCDHGKCTYDHYGSCSGALIGPGAFLTAAHCVAAMRRDAARVSRSEILLPDERGAPTRRLELGRITVGKSDFAHDWASAEPDPLDAAVVEVKASVPWLPAGPLPRRGAPLFVAGYPRVEGRSAAARTRHGYGLVAGTPAASFGRMVDANRGRRPFCSTDGNQERWRLAAPCPFRKLPAGHAGVITGGAFLTSVDNINGYSGAPVFDARGQIIGINVTVAGGENPQVRYAPHSRAVGVAVCRALVRLGEAGPPGLFAGRPADHCAE